MGCLPLLSGGQVDLDIPSRVEGNHAAVSICECRQRLQCPAHPACTPPQGNNQMLWGFDCGRTPPCHQGCLMVRYSSAQQQRGRGTPVGIAGARVVPRRPQSVRPRGVQPRVEGEAGEGRGPGCRRSRWVGPYPEDTSSTQVFTTVCTLRALRRGLPGMWVAGACVDVTVPHLTIGQRAVRECGPE
jgi:hypothetical protein